MSSEGISSFKCYHFISDYRVGGQHMYVDTLRKALKGKGEHIIVTPGHGSMTDIALIQLRHYWKPLYILEIIFNTFLISGLVYMARIRKGSFIFHVHGGATLAPIIAARIMNIPVVWTIHETVGSYKYFVKLGRWLLKGLLHQLVIVAEVSRNAFHGFAEAILIPGAVDETYWSRRHVPIISSEEVWGKGESSSRKTEKPFRVLSVGNLNPLKGADILLSALDALDKPWVLNIVGMPLVTQQDYIRRLYKSAENIMSGDTNKMIHLSGWKSAEEVRSLLAGCDVFVLPSRSEACPIALLEAMAMGCYCIASDVGDVRAMLSGYKRSSVFSATNSDELLTQLETCWSESSLSFGRKNTDSIGIYTMTSMAVSYENIYSQLIRLPS